MLPSHTFVLTDLNSLGPEPIWISEFFFVMHLKIAMAIWICVKGVRISEGPPHIICWVEYSIMLDLTLQSATLIVVGWQDHFHQRVLVPV